MVDIKHSNILELYELRKHAFSGGGEQRIELLRRDVVALQQRPRVLVGIGRVHAADEVGREAVGGLVPVERFEGARQDHTAEIPEHCSDHGRRAYDDGAAADVIDPTSLAE